MSPSQNVNCDLGSRYVYLNGLKNGQSAGQVDYVQVGHLSVHLEVGEPKGSGFRIIVGATVLP